MSSMVRYRYFPGCSLHSTAAEYDRSFRAVFSRLGLVVEELTDWNCCGSNPLHGTDPILSLALPYRNLNIASRAGGGALVVPCASCYARLKVARHQVAEQPGVRRRVEKVLDEPCAGDVEVLHPLEVLLREFKPETLAGKISRPLRGLKVACYYGCLLTRPPGVMRFDDAEYPRSMDLLLKAAGCDPVDWSHKTECCGASLTLTDPARVRELVAPVVEDARACGAVAIAAACPLCQSNLETRQAEQDPIPVLYFTQLLGLALGMGPEELGLDRLLIDPLPVIVKYLA